MEIATNQVHDLYPEKLNKKADRIGVIASILCAIHCALTPVLLIAMPAFGKAWAHPATHWGMALVVIPIAILMLVKGYRKHRKKWVVGVGSLGILFIIVGAILPYTEIGTSGESANLSTANLAPDPTVGGG